MKTLIPHQDIVPRPVGAPRFPRPAGGSGVCPPPPFNSVPGLAREMRQAAFESSSKIYKKLLQSFKGKDQVPKVSLCTVTKCHNFAALPMTANLSQEDESMTLSESNKPRVITLHISDFPCRSYEVRSFM